MQIARGVWVIEETPRALCGAILGLAYSSIVLEE